MNKMNCLIIIIIKTIYGRYPSAAAGFLGALYLHTKYQEILKTYLQLLFDKKFIKKKLYTEIGKVNT